jgi:bidirectional [NiFe] hydrogenase diaphorase subunit
MAKILEHASGDKRFKILEAHMKKHQFNHDALIEVLHKAQELFGFLEDDLLLFIAHKLKLPSSRVYGVATFYHFFTLKPNGQHTCVVCMGTACYVKGADKLLAAVEQKAGIKAGETTPDGAFSIVEEECLAACANAPMMICGDNYFLDLTPEKVDVVIDELRRRFREDPKNDQKSAPLNRTMFGMGPGGEKI